MFKKGDLVHWWDKELYIGIVFADQKTGTGNLVPVYWINQGPKSAEMTFRNGLRYYYASSLVKITETQ